MWRLTQAVAENCFIIRLTYGRMGIFIFLLRKPSFLCIFGVSVDMLGEAQIRGYVEAQIPSILNRFKGLSMHGVIVPEGLRDRVMSKSRHFDRLNFIFAKI